MILDGANTGCRTKSTGCKGTTKSGITTLIIIIFLKIRIGIQTQTIGNIYPIRKFVIQTGQDMLEVLDLTRRYNMTQVYLMPEGRTREEQLARQQEVKIMCDSLGFHFSQRLHVLAFGNKRGV